MSTHSPGAVRAAERICKMAGFPPIMVAVLARMIDDETACKELAEALRAIVGTPGVRRVSDELHEQGLRAIAKWECRA